MRACQSCARSLFFASVFPGDQHQGPQGPKAAGRWRVPILRFSRAFSSFWRTNTKYRRASGAESGSTGERRCLDKLTI